MHVCAYVSMCGHSKNVYKMCVLFVWCVVCVSYVYSVCNVCACVCGACKCCVVCVFCVCFYGVCVIFVV